MRIVLVLSLAAIGAVVGELIAAQQPGGQRWPLVGLVAGGLLGLWLAATQLPRRRRSPARAGARRRPGHAIGSRAGEERTRNGRGGGNFSALQTAEVYGLPLAAPLPLAAELLGRPLPEVERAAAKVAPYRHVDGSPRWSVRLVNLGAIGRASG
jgi:hypothetical protein